MRPTTVSAGLLALVLMTAASGFAQGDAPTKEKTPPAATLKLEAKAVSAGIGFSWGQGTLTYQGKDYPIDVSGISVGAVGLTSITARGDVHDLKKLEDFDGNYTGAGAAATVGGGAGVVALRNSNGVGVELMATTKGVSLAVAAGGVTMKIKK